MCLSLVLKKNSLLETCAVVRAVFWKSLTVSSKSLAVSSGSSAVFSKSSAVFSKSLAVFSKSSAVFSQCQKNGLRSQAQAL